MNPAEQNQNPTPVAMILDTETTGFSRPMSCIEVGYILLGSLDNYQEGNYLLGLPHTTFQQAYKNTRPIEKGAFMVHGKSAEMLKNFKPYTWESLNIPDSVEYLICHSVPFDREVLGYPKRSDGSEFVGIDTVTLAKHFWPGRRSYKLTNLMKEFYPDQAGSLIANAHGALVDSKLTLLILQKAMVEFDISSWEELAKIGK